MMFDHCTLLCGQVGCLLTPASLPQAISHDKANASGLGLPALREMVEGRLNGTFVGPHKLKCKKYGRRELVDLATTSKINDLWTAAAKEPRKKKKQQDDPNDDSAQHAYQLNRHAAGVSFASTF
jgi:hypothetical protein